MQHTTDRPRPPKPDHRAVFLEAVYADGQSYRDTAGGPDDTEEDDQP